MRPPKKYNFPDALQRLRRYCAYQERAHVEVRRKLYEWGFDREDTDRVIVQLMEEGYLNEERFAKALAGGKFRQKGWGRRKITEALRQKGVGEYLMKKSLGEIDPNDYRAKLRTHLEKKLLQVRGEPVLQQKAKLLRFGLSKGYEQDLVLEVMRELMA